MKDKKQSIPPPTKKKNTFSLIFEISVHWLKLGLPNVVCCTPWRLSKRSHTAYEGRNTNTTSATSENMRISTKVLSCTKTDRLGM